MIVGAEILIQIFEWRTFEKVLHIRKVLKLILIGRET